MKIILGVTGCIAAYKAPTILRLLQEEGYQIQPVMTSSAREFITPLTLEKLSGNRVFSDLSVQQSQTIEHIALARDSRLLLVAPATANILAKFSAGIADDFLTTLYVSTLTPVVVAPAMNVEMWRHAATQANLKTLEARGVVVVPPASGYLACGEYGEGRLADPEVICQTVLHLLRQSRTLSGVRVLVTAGPTIEDLDPVRFVSNRSSGKMGYELASEALRRGAEVALVSGPTSLDAPRGVDLVSVRSAEEMATATLDRFASADIVVMAAAVSDFRPEGISAQKIKKSDQAPEIRFSRTRDILTEMSHKKERQMLVGFAAESEKLLDNARDKLRKKSLDLVVANDISLPDQGFQSDYNQVVLVDRTENVVESPRLTKSEIAAFIWDHISSLRAVSSQ